MDQNLSGEAGVKIRQGLNYQYPYGRQKNLQSAQLVFSFDSAA
jgi:hypothetical protein